LHVRRLGFEPRSLTIQGERDQAALAIRLVPSLAYLDVVVVRAERKKFTGRLAGYYARLERGTQGQFITREDLEREQPTQLTDMLQRQPGIRITRGRPGAQSIRMRGRDCRPLIWLDGSAMPAGDVDLDSFSPASLEGIELYLGASAPAGFQAARGQSECGTVLLWSRGVDTEPRQRGQMTTPAELEALLLSISVYRADQVETRATLDLAAGWPVAYPPALRASGTGGRVIAEFVVDTLGRVEESHFGIVSSTDPLFSAAVRESASSARFSPAVRGGHRVRQLVRQPFDFQPDGRKP
jgi:TonB family protein